MMQPATSHPSRSIHWAVWIVVFVTLSLSYLVSTSEPLDLRADRLVTLAAWDGADPYATVERLAERYGSAFDWTHVHPRTPGALLVQSPLVLVPEGVLRVLSALMTAGTITALGVVVDRLVPGHRYAAPLTALVAGVSSVAFESATVGAQSTLLAALLGFGWVRLRREDDRVGGLAVGMAVTLKVFPWILLGALAIRRPRATLAGGLTVVGLNSLGLLFPGVTVQGAVEAVASANLSRSAALNGSVLRLVDSVPVSVATWVLVGAGLVLVFVLNRSEMTFDRLWVWGLVAAIVLSPLLWRHYVLVLVPVAAWLALRGGLVAKLAVGAGIIWLFLPDPLLGVALAVPVSLVLGVAALSARSEAIDDGVPEVDRTL